MGRIDLAAHLADARDRVAAQPTRSFADEASAGPRFAKLRRKETRLRDDQLASLTALARRLMKRRRVRAERITENTLIRIAIDALLARQELLSGSSEAELRNSVTLELPDTGHEAPIPGDERPASPIGHRMLDDRTSETPDVPEVWAPHSSNRTGDRS